MFITHPEKELRTSTYKINCYLNYLNANMVRNAFKATCFQSVSDVILEGQLSQIHYICTKQTVQMYLDTSYSLYPLSLEMSEAQFSK